MKNVLVISPNQWDEAEIVEQPRQDYNFQFCGPLLQKDDPSIFQILKFLLTFHPIKFAQRTACRYRAEAIHGILGTDDYMACPVAAVLAAEMGLPGPDPKVVVLAMHKVYSRQLQQRICPEATPQFAAIGSVADVRRSGFEYPFFIKPVRGTGSLLAQKIHSEEELKRYLKIGLFKRQFLRLMLRPYNILLEHYDLEPMDQKLFIIEECLEGTQVTFEGFMNRGEFYPLGVVDSVMYPHSKICFNRFVYPSRHTFEVQKRMERLAQKVISGFGYDHGVFNIEFFYDETTDRIQIIELNPRLSFQFTDFFKHIDGFNSFDIQLALVCGERGNVLRRQGAYKVASSFALRKFADHYVKRAPTSREIEGLKLKYPELRIRLFAHQGSKMSSQWLEDPESYRYAVFNLMGQSEPDILEKYEQVKDTLDRQYVFQPLS